MSNLKKWIYKYDNHIKVKRDFGNMILLMDQTLDSELRKVIYHLCRNLSHRYKLPGCLIINVQDSNKVAAPDGEQVLGVIWDEMIKEDLYIRIELAAGDYKQMVAYKGKNYAMYEIIYLLCSYFTIYLVWLKFPPRISVKYRITPRKLAEKLGASMAKAFLNKISSRIS